MNTVQDLKDTVDFLDEQIGKLNRIKFAYEPIEKAPKFNLIIEQEHNYYLRCFVCGRANEFKSQKVLDRFECPICEAEFTIDGQMLYDGQAKHYYPF